MNCSQLSQALYTTVADDERCSEMETLTSCDLVAPSGGGPHCQVTCTCKGIKSCKVKLARGTQLGNEGSFSICDVQQIQN